MKKKKKNSKIYESDESDENLISQALLNASAADGGSPTTQAEQDEPNAGNSYSRANRSNRSSIKVSLSANPIISGGGGGGGEKELSKSQTNSPPAGPSSAGEFSTREIPSFSFQNIEDTDDQDGGGRGTDNNADDSKNNLDTDTANNSNENLLGSSSFKLTSFYSKFLTGSNIITDRGCIVNIRTGSFNLGCTNNSASSNSLMPGNGHSGNEQASSTHFNKTSPHRHSNIGLVNDTELIDSSEFFSSLQHNYGGGRKGSNGSKNQPTSDLLMSSDFLRNSNSNYSFRSSFNSNLDHTSSSHNPYSSNNVSIPLLLVTKCRKKSFSGGENNAPSSCVNLNESTGVEPTARSSESIDRTSFFSDSLMKSNNSSNNTGEFSLKNLLLLYLKILLRLESFLKKKS
jgi:hypothetical protein